MWRNDFTSRALVLGALTSLLMWPSNADAQRLAESRIGAMYGAPPVSSFSVSVEEPKAKPPSGAQVVAGYMSAMLIGFVSWKAFDEPAGKHSRVKQDWGYTPRAHIALAIGSFAGATAGVWGSGRVRGSKGKMLGTAIGVAIPTVPLLLENDNPLLPFIAAIAGMPLQGILGYVGYRATATP
jgi:hypothetical protein